MKSPLPDEKRKGRPARKVTRAAFSRICSSIIEGDSLRKAAKTEGLSASTVLYWVKKDKAAKEEYERACEWRIELYADMITDLLNEAHEAALDIRHGRERLQAIKIKIDTIKWQLSKLLPQRYGEATQIEISGKNGADLLPKHTAEQDAAFLRMLADIQAKTPPPPDRTQN